MNRLFSLGFALCLIAFLPAVAQMEIQTGGTIRKTNAPPGGPGSSYHKAVPITARDETSGVASEYSYLAKHFTGSKPINHSREWYAGRMYDVITFTTAGGDKRSLFFKYSVVR